MLVVLPFLRIASFVEFQVGQLLCSKKKIFQVLRQNYPAVRGRPFGQAHGKVVDALLLLLQYQIRIHIQGFSSGSASVIYSDYYSDYNPG